MEKSKLGISIGLLGALMFMSGYFGITAVLLVAGYILLREESKTLKKYAVGTIAVYLAFALLGMCMSLISNIFNMANFGGWMYDTSMYTIVNGFISTVNHIISIAKLVIYGLLAMLALFTKEVKIPLVDKFVEKHF